MAATDEDISYFGEIFFSMGSFYGKKEQQWECLAQKSCSMNEYIEFNDGSLNYLKHTNLDNLQSILAINASECSSF